MSVNFGVGPFDSALLCSGPSTRLRTGLRGSFDFAALRFAPFRFAQDERWGVASLRGSGALRLGSGCSEGALSSRGLALRLGSGQTYAHPSTSLHSALLRSASLRTNGWGVALLRGSVALRRGSGQALRRGSGQACLLGGGKIIGPWKEREKALLCIEFLYQPGCILVKVADEGDELWPVRFYLC